MRKIFLVLLLVLFINGVSGAIDQERQDRIDFGHVVDITGVGIEPESFQPGRTVNLSLVIENNANFEIHDIRVELVLPDQLSFTKDLSKRKIGRMESGESKKIIYDIIALPTTSEGIYEAILKIEYVNHVGTERKENDTFGIIIRSKPKMFAQIEKTSIYKGNYIGDVTIQFINNDVGDIKFLTVDLKDGENFKVIPPNVKYIGDLDSDDFESVEFRLKVDRGIKEFVLPLQLDYKDSFNQEYSEVLSINFPIRTAEEVGIEKNNTIYIVVIVLIILVVGWYVYRKRKKKQKLNRKY